MRDNPDELFPEVDEIGNVIGEMTRAEAHSGTKRLHPVVHVHLFNSKGELYLQHRPKWKDIQPDRWDTSCGGHVESGESIDDAVKRELLEELGVNNVKMKHIGNYVFESSRERELVYMYFATYDGEVHPSKDELDGGRFFSGTEIKQRMGSGMLTPNFESEITRVINAISENI